jgi:hypothetical protein
MGKTKKEESSSSSSSSSESDSSKEDKKEEKKDEEKKEEKKPKVKKAKKVSSNATTYSKKYSSLFNNKSHSDFEIKVGDETFNLHKIIFQCNSDFFDKHEGKSFTFPEEDDKLAAKSLLKFYYTGEFEYVDPSEVITFTLLATKYKSKFFSVKIF